MAHIEKVYAHKIRRGSPQDQAKQQGKPSAGEKDSSLFRTIKCHIEKEEHEAVTEQTRQGGASDDTVSTGYKGAEFCEALNQADHGGEGVSEEESGLGGYPGGSHREQREEEDDKEEGHSNEVQQGCEEGQGMEGSGNNGQGHELYAQYSTQALL